MRDEGRLAKGLGLFGFVFLGGVGRVIFITLCAAKGWVVFELERIGFVLHN